ncbi:MFS transporter [Roseomonas sp. NAR14]|uniref:MFS transporter n=1 Tax=Roseomonas acroporae TaxID=2937791 RepID=A0A9X1YB84_9PROT|nr:MFS transporter [Roseomonas acroporae]MCK8786520.1 MFS transporter [Roseomonas acroporae]
MTAHPPPIHIPPGAGRAPQPAVLPSLGPLVAIVFLGFLAVAIPLPALSLHLHETLGFSPVVVGWTIGLQSIAAVLTRHRAGGFCDTHGSKPSVLLGLPLAVAAGLAYLLASPLAGGAALGVILLGRVVLGLGESLFLTGTMSWGIARLGPQRTGMVMAWQGIAMYASLGLGAAAGIPILRHFGFAGVAVCAMACPLLALAIAARLPGAPAMGGRRAPFHRVLGLIWRPGLVLTLGSMPFAVMASFLALYYADRGWDGAGLGIAGFGAGYILVRLFVAHWPDRHGGVRVGAASLVVEAIGQALMWLAGGPVVAGLGAVLTGMGFSLVFPSMGVEATRHVPAAQRGQAVAGFMAFFDVALGLTGPLAGLAIARFGYPSAFLAGVAVVLLALALLLGGGSRTGRAAR